MFEFHDFDDFSTEWENEKFVFDLNGGKIFYSQRRFGSVIPGDDVDIELVNSWKSSDHNATTRILKNCSRKWLFADEEYGGKYRETENRTSTVHSLFQKLLTVSHPNVVQHFGTRIHGLSESVLMECCSGK